MQRTGSINENLNKGVASTASSSSASPSSAPALTIEQQTEQALQVLAIYFSAQFPLREKTTAYDLFFKVLGYRTNYQGIYSLPTVTNSYRAALSSFERAKHVIDNIKPENFTAINKKETSKIITNIQETAPGRRFPTELSDWLDLFNNTTLENTRKLIIESQLIFNENKITQSQYADFIRGNIYASKFEEMSMLPSKTPEIPGVRPKDVVGATDTDYKLAALLAKTLQKTNPSFIESVRTLFTILETYPSMHKVLYEAASKTKNDEARDNFPKHCAVIQAVLLTLANESAGVDRKAACNIHWNNKSNAYKSNSFVNTRESLGDFTIEETKYARDSIIKPIADYIDGKNGARLALITRILDYVDGLSAQLEDKINTFQSTPTVTNAFNPLFALETIQAIRAYVKTPEFRASLDPQLDAPVLVTTDEIILPATNSTATSAVVAPSSATTPAKIETTSTTTSTTTVTAASHKDEKQEINKDKKEENKDLTHEQAIADAERKKTEQNATEAAQLASVITTENQMKGTGPTTVINKPVPPATTSTTAHPSSPTLSATSSASAASNTSSKSSSSTSARTNFSGRGQSNSNNNNNKNTNDNSSNNNNLNINPGDNSHTKKRDRGQNNR